MVLRIPFGLVLVLALGACGGGASSGDGASFDTLFESIDRFDDDLAVSADADLPLSGGARYEGVAIAVGENAAGADDLRFGALGSARITADFRAGTMTGSVSNFFEVNDLDDFEGSGGTSIPGTIAITLSEDVPGENYYTGETTGSLTTTENNIIRFDLPAVGVFFGADVQQLNIEAEDTDAALFIIAQ